MNDLSGMKKEDIGDMQDTLELGEIRQQLQQQEMDLLEHINEEKARQQGNTINPDRSDLAQSYDMRQRRSAMLTRLENQLEQVRGALNRLDEGTYGNCENCGEPILPARLRAMPQATLCIDCQEKLERS
jgi:DnaK suppressor protein